MTKQKKTPTAGKSARAARKHPETTVHFYVLLDRSGSMESMRTDVIGGFNAFLDEQLAEPGRARLTLVQFDTQDHQEVLLDGAHLQNAKPLSAASFQPRGGTPLLDATVTLIERIHGRAAARKAMGKTPEEIVVITITDGEENSSRRASLDQVRSLVENGKESGWSFVFLGAGIDAYEEAQRLGYDNGSVQAFAAHGDGAKAMWKSVSRASSQLRYDVAAHMAVDKASYFRGLKEAEAQQEGSNDAN
jgi:uncharacterized protein YegL